MKIFKFIFAVSDDFVFVTIIFAFSREWKSTSEIFSNAFLPQHIAILYRHIKWTIIIRIPKASALFEKMFSHEHNSWRNMSRELKQTARHKEKNHSTYGRAAGKLRSSINLLPTSNTAELRLISCSTETGLLQFIMAQRYSISFGLEGSLSILAR